MNYCGGPLQTGPVLSAFHPCGTHIYSSSSLPPCPTVDDDLGSSELVQRKSETLDLDLFENGTDFQQMGACFGVAASCVTLNDGLASVSNCSFL